MGATHSLRSWYQSRSIKQGALHCPGVLSLQPPTPPSSSPGDAFSHLAYRVRRYGGKRKYLWALIKGYDIDVSVACPALHEPRYCPAERALIRSDAPCGKASQIACIVVEILEVIFLKSLEGSTDITEDASRLVVVAQVNRHWVSRSPPAFSRRPDDRICRTA